MMSDDTKKPASAAAEATDAAKTKAAPKPAAKAKAEAKAKSEPKPKADSKAKTEAKAKATKTTTKPKAKAEAKTEVKAKSSAKPKTEAKAKADAKATAKAKSKAEAKPKADSKAKSDPKAEATTEAEATDASPKATDAEATVVVDTEAAGDEAAATPPKDLPDPQIDDLGRAYATGRRKEASARVWIKPGKGDISINGKPVKIYFARPVLRMLLDQPFAAANRTDAFDVTATVRGGGLSGQAGAVRHGISHALVRFEPSLRPRLKAGGFLTRDSRAVERKKYGRRKARRSFQFSKR